MTFNHLAHCDKEHRFDEKCNQYWLTGRPEPKPKHLLYCNNNHYQTECCNENDKIVPEEAEEPTEPEVLRSFTEAQLALLFEYVGFLQNFDLGDMERTKLALAMLGDPLIKSAVYVLGKGPM